MSILSDRRTLREIGGVGAYVRQVGWSLWWRTQPAARPATTVARPQPSVAATRDSKSSANPSPQASVQRTSIL